MLRTRASLLILPPIGHLVTASMSYSIHVCSTGERDLLARGTFLQSITFIGTIEVLYGTVRTIRCYALERRRGSSLAMLADTTSDGAIVLIPTIATACTPTSAFGLRCYPTNGFRSVDDS